MKIAFFALGIVAGVSGAQVTTFSHGTEGWSVSGRDNISPTGGNPGAHMDVQLIDVFGADIRNSTGPFIGNLNNFGVISLTVDIQVDSIDFFGSPVTRDLVVELRNFDTPGWGGFASIWAPIGTLTNDHNAWTTYSMDLDTHADTLPDGWFGAGDEDPNTFEPILPPGVTMQDVLSGVDEIAFTTFVPGFFFGFTNFDISVDNVGLIVPSPGGAIVLALGGFIAVRRRR